MTRPIHIDTFLDCMKVLRTEALTRKQIAEECNVSIDTAERWVSKLQERGMVDIVGVHHNMIGENYVGGRAPEIYMLTKAWGGLA